MVAAFKYESKLWAAGVSASWACDSNEPEWRELDRELCSIAARRAALDAEELALIRKAIRIQLWRPLGMTSMREYLENKMGYSPQVAAERLRVSDALEGLPAIERALATNELSYSAVRELTRIATRKTEDAWLTAARGKNLRQIEELVSEREPGAGPDSPPNPDLRVKRVMMDLRPEVIAQMRRSQALLDSVRGERTDNNDLLGEAFRCLLVMHGGVTASEAADSDAADSDAADSDAAVAVATMSPRAQIAITKCESCDQGWQLAAGRKIAITAAELEAAECDAVHIGSLDHAGHRRPERATSTIPPATARFVIHRDGGRCTVPGCRSAQNLEIHHIVHREHGGANDPENLTLLCWGHHAAHHRGELLIAGKAPLITVTKGRQVPHVGDHQQKKDHQVPHVGDHQHTNEDQVPHVGDRDHLQAQALLALTTLGFKKPEAIAALAKARERIEPDASLETLLRAALRECPR